MRAKYARTHRAEESARNATYCARKSLAPGRGVTPAEWQQVLAESLGICAYCNECKPLTMDHIEPLVRGGAHDIDNICAACLSCNSSKNDTPLLLWLAMRTQQQAVA